MWLAPGYARRIAGLGQLLWACAGATLTEMRPGPMENPRNYVSPWPLPWLPLLPADPGPRPGTGWQVPYRLSTPEINASGELSQLPLYYPALSERQTQAHLRVLRAHTAYCIRNRIVHAALGGVVLGALRHHGFVPWDPDSDFGFTTADGQRYRDAAKTDAKFLAARGVQVVDAKPVFRGCYMALPETLESTFLLSQPVPTLEAKILDAITWGHHCGDAAPALELRHNTSMLRLLFGENGAPLITCAKEVQKWIHVSKTFDCNAAWNHPAPNDRLCGLHLFAGAGKQNVSWQTPPSFNQFKARWEKMLEKGSEGNPGGMWSKCGPLGPVYNFALPEVRHDLVGEHVLANVAELLDAENWECFDASWSPQGWVPSNAPGAHRRWAVLQHSLRSTALERNRTAVSGRHTFLIKFQASLSSRSQNNSWSPLLEAHVETRRSDGGELWASMLGLSSPGGGMDPAWCLVLPGPQAPDHHQHRKWTLLRDAPPR